MPSERTVSERPPVQKRFKITKGVVPSGAIEYYTSNPNAAFQPANSQYHIPVDFPYQSGAVERLIEEARRETLRLNGTDDLSYTGLYYPHSKLYQQYRVAHAAEHLTVALMLDQGLIQTQPPYIAHTLVLTSLPLHQRIAFVFDRRVADETIIDRSVERVSETIAVKLRESNLSQPTQPQKSASILQE